MHTVAILTIDGCIITPPERLPLRGAESVVMSVFVCLYLLTHISEATRPNFTKFYVHVACRYGWILLCWFCNNVMFFRFCG